MNLVRLLRVGPLAGIAILMLVGWARPALTQTTTSAAVSEAAPVSEPLPADLWTRVKGTDWPTFLGPQHNGTSTETGLITPWPPQGPRVLWQRKLGEGYGIGSVARGRMYQAERNKDIVFLRCLNAETGLELWNYQYPTQYTDTYGYDGGPRCSPVIDGARVYFFGADGHLVCLSASDGKVNWQLDTAKEFGVVQNFFGVGSTPIIDDDLLIVMIGGSPPESQAIPPGQLDRVEPNGSAIVAFDKFTGKVRYRVGNDLASYAAPVVARIGRRDRGFAFCRSGLILFAPENGRLEATFPWRARLFESANAATPVVVDDQVLVSETYGPGSALLRVTEQGLDVVWQDDPRRRQKAMQSHWATPIYHDGHLYGCSGRNPPVDLRCIEWQTGTVKWTLPNQYRMSLLYVDQHFICLDETGVLRLIRSNAEKYDLVSEVKLRSPQPAPSEREPLPLLKYPCWAAPILSHGLLYVRGKDRLVCLEVIADEKQASDER